MTFNDEKVHFGILAVILKRGKDQRVILADSKEYAIYTNLSKSLKGIHCLTMFSL